MIQNSATRRTFLGSMATALGLVGLRPSFDLFAQDREGRQGDAGVEHPEEDYENMAKLANNENCWGPSDAVMKAMNDGFKYANRYRYPDGGIVGAFFRPLCPIGHTVLAGH